MAGGLPRELEVLLAETDSSLREEAWAAFLDRHSRLLLRAARSFGGDYDAAMDRYEYALEQLRADEFKRLRSYSPRGASRFESWLVVVVRRLCLDLTRARYGRARDGETKETSEERSMRRRLAELAGLELKEDLIASSLASNPERELRRMGLVAALDAAIEELPPRDRILIKLRFDDGLSVGKVADVLDFPSVFHVYRRLRLVLAQLRSLLHERGVHDGTP